MGLEHVNVAVLKAMKKGTRVQRVLDRIRQALELGLDTNFFVILFSKWETRQTLVELIDVSSRLALEGGCLVYNWGFQPLRGADISKDPSNQYLRSQEQVETFRFEQRGKIVPDDKEMATWFRHMNEHLDAYFGLQDELLSRVADFGRTSQLDARSPWIRRIFRQHRNVNLSNTLTNLVRFHSMFEYGRRFLSPEDSYFVEEANHTWGTVLAYVFNGPTYPHNGSATSIRRKMAFLAKEIDSDWGCDVAAKLAVELDVVRIGMRAPNHPVLKPDSVAHHVWVVKALPRWREGIEHVDTCSEAGAYAKAALEEIEGWLGGCPTHEGSECDTPIAKNLDYIL